MRKQPLLIPLVLLLINVFIFSSCNKEDSNSNLTELRGDVGGSPGSGTGVGSITKYKIDNLKLRLAEKLSCVVEADPTMLQVFSELAATTKANGHYENEFFWNLEKDVQRPALGNMSIAQTILANFPTEQPLLDSLCAFIPALTILQLGDSIGNVITPSMFSKKIYVDNEFDDMDVNTLIPYYENCTLSSTSILYEPTDPTFIIRTCETYLAPQDLVSDIYLKTDADTIVMGTVCGNDIVLWEPPVLGPPTSGGGGDPCNEPCERDCVNGKENIHRMRARDKYDPWRGKGEFRFYAIYANDISYTTDPLGNITFNGNPLGYVIKKCDGVKDNNTWIYPNLDIINWSLTSDGDRIKYVLYEEDRGDSYEIPVSLKFKITGIEAEKGLTITIRDGHDFIGESIVDYCDDIDSDGFEYHPSNKVDFVMNER